MGIDWKTLTVHNLNIHRHTVQYKMYNSTLGWIGSRLILHAGIQLAHASPQ